MFSILDAVRDYMRVGFSRLCSPEYASLFTGEKGEQLDHVAPHLFQGDPHGMIAHLTLAGLPPGDVGIVLECPLPFVEVRRHLRRFLTVQRERDRKRVFFRYYDPRVLRAFLPVCTPAEIRQFFGPIRAMHCQAENAGSVFTFSHRDGRLEIVSSSVPDFFHRQYGVPADAVAQLTAGVLFKPAAV